MTPAVRLLKQQQVDFELLQYDHTPQNHHFGKETVEKLNLNPEVVYKTLLVDIGKKDFIVAILCVNKTLCLKRIAKIMGVKKAEMANKQKAQTVTGYLLGGISPFGQKKLLKTLLDDTAKQQPYIYLSGGKRGLEIKVNPQAVIQLLNAQYASISTASLTIP